MSVIDTGTNTVVDSISVGSSPFGGNVSPDGSSVYVTNFDGGTVSVIDASTNTVVATVTVGGSPAVVATSPDGTRAYVANNTSGNVAVIETGTNAVVANVEVGAGSFGVAVTLDGTKAFVTNFDGGGYFSVIDTVTNVVVETVITGSGLGGLAMMPTPGPVIDIKPGSDPNSINLKSKGVIPVAILSYPNFDAITEVDASMVAFGPNGASPAHKGHIDDVDGDGDFDAVFHFRTQETGIGPNDNEACLTITLDGTPIEACDDIRITPGSGKGKGN